MALVKIRRAAQITLPREIREAARLAEGDYLDARVTEAGILLRPVRIGSREPTAEEAAEIQAAASKVRADLARARRAARGR